MTDDGRGTPGRRLCARTSTTDPTLSAISHQPSAIRRQPSALAPIRSKDRTASGFDGAGCSTMTTSHSIPDRRRRFSSSRRADPTPATPTAWPVFERAPQAAFLDVDGTLLAETTTYLFARVLRRKGLLKRSILLRAMYHGLQHRFGRLDYGRLVAFGLRDRGHPGRGARTHCLRELRRAHSSAAVSGRGRAPRRVAAARHARRARVLFAGSGDRAPGPVSGLRGAADHAGPDRGRPPGRHGGRTALLRRRETALGRGVGPGTRDFDGRSRRVRR